MCVSTKGVFQVQASMQLSAGPQLAEALGSVPGTGGRDPVETFKQWLPVPELLRPMSYEEVFTMK